MESAEGGDITYMPESFDSRLRMARRMMSEVEPLTPHPVSIKRWLRFSGCGG